MTNFRQKTKFIALYDMFPGKLPILTRAVRVIYGKIVLTRSVQEHVMTLITKKYLSEEHRTKNIVTTIGLTYPSITLSKREEAVVS